MDLSNIKTSDYIESNSSNEGKILADLRRETELKCLNPIMLSSKVQGIFLSIISKIIKPKNVLEIGTYSGYSTLCIAAGLGTDGMIPVSYTHLPSPRDYAASRMPSSA